MSPLFCICTNSSRDPPFPFLAPFVSDSEEYSENASSFYPKEGQQTSKPTLIDEKDFAMETPQQHEAALEYSIEKQKLPKLPKKGSQLSRIQRV